MTGADPLPEPPLPRVAVLTVNTNGGHHLPAFAASLRALTYPKRHVVVVDNGSTDGSRERLPELFPGATVIENGQNLGFPGAVNAGLRYCLREGFDYVLILNDDTTHKPDFLSRLVERADRRTLVAPKTLLADSSDLLDDAAGDYDWWRGVWRRPLLGKPAPPGFDREREVTMANLSCLLVPTAAFRQVGLLDERFFLYGEDTDFVQRARRAGYRVWFHPGAVIYHRRSATTGGAGSPFALYYLTRNRPYLMRKHLPRPRYWLFLAYFLATRAAWALRFLARRRLDLLAAMAAGLRDYARGRMGATRMPPRPRPPEP